MYTLNNVKANDVITMVYTISSGWGDQGGGISGNVGISAQAGIIRPLIATEVKDIGKQASATSYGRLNNGTWYGELPNELTSTCTAGTIALGNARGFLTVTLNDGQKVKVPYYGL